MQRIGTESGVAFAVLYLALIIPLEVADFGYGVYRGILLATLLALLAGWMFLPRLSSAPFQTALQPWLMLAALSPAAAAFLSIGTPYRVRVLAGLIVACVIVILLSQERISRLGGRAIGRAAVLMVGLALLIVLANLVSGLMVPKLAEPATTTAAAVRALWSGQNPYAIPVDAEGFALMNQDIRFAGYKYPPLMPVLYLPFVLVLGETGVIAGNVVLFAGLAAAMVQLVRRLNGQSAMLAVLLLLATPTASYEPFAAAQPDLASVLALIVAFLLWGKGPWLVGLFVGVSLCLKPLPALFAVAFCAPASPREWVRYGLGVGCGLFPALIYFAWDPMSFYYNIVVFNLGRPVDTTSWRFWAPDWIGKASGIPALLLWVALSIRCIVTRAGLLERLRMFVLVVIAIQLTAPIAHVNYFMWWIPLLAVLVTTFGEARAPGAMRASAT